MDNCVIQLKYYFLFSGSVDSNSSEVTKSVSESTEILISELSKLSEWKCRRGKSKKKDKSESRNSLPDITDSSSSSAAPIPPPLPPKSSSGNHKSGHYPENVDWFSNPLFEETPKKQRNSCYETSFISNPRTKSEQNHPDVKNQSFSENGIFDLETTFDTSFGSKCREFPFMDDVVSPVKERPVTFNNNDLDLDPPALPKKELRRKRSQYDNVWNPDDPPPLPPKKRDIINYMEMLGNSLISSKL